MPGAKSIYFDECISGNFIGVDFGFKKDLSNYQNDNFRTFSNENRPVYLKNRPTIRKRRFVDRLINIINPLHVSILHKYEKLIRERSKIYELSNYKINCDKLDKVQIINKILDIYENK